MKRKKTIPPPPFDRKRGSQSQEPDFQQVSFASLKRQNMTPTRFGGHQKP